MESTLFEVPLVPAMLAWQQKRNTPISVSLTVTFSALVLTGCSKLLSTLSPTTLKSIQVTSAGSALLHVKIFGATTPSGAVAVQVRLKVL